MLLALFPGNITLSTGENAGVVARLHKSSISETCIVIMDDSDVGSRPEKTIHVKGVCLPVT